MLTRWKRRIVTLLLLVYTSQSIAALLLPCPMDAAMAKDAVMPPTDSMHHAMGHAMHGMAHDHAMTGHTILHDGTAIKAATTAVQPTDGHEKFDCCDAMGHCLTGGCMMHGASNDFAQALDVAARKALHSGHLKSPSCLNSVHFRPPIFA